MKIRLLFLAGIIFFSLTTTYAQVPGLENAEVAWGRLEKVPRRSLDGYLVGADEQGVYMLRSQYAGMFPRQYELSNCYIERYDSDLNLVRTAALGGAHGFTLEKTVMLEDKIFVFSSYFNKESDAKQLFVQTFDKQLMRMSNDRRQVSEIFMESSRNTGSFNIRLSPDESKVLVLGKGSYEKNQPERYLMQVFDGGMKELWKKDVSLPYPDEKFSLENYRVDHLGNVYVSGKLYDKMRKGLFSGTLREKEDGNPNYKYLVIAYLDGASKVQEYPVELPGKFITDMNLRTTREGNITCGGFYSDNEGRRSVKGTFFMTVDVKNQQVLNKGHRDFDFEVKNEFMSERKAKKDNSELYNFRLSDIILRDDGGQVLVAEKYYVQVYTTRDYRGFITTYYVYHYEDLIVVNVNPDGSIDWTTKIPKMYSTTIAQSLFESYTLFTHKDKMHFVFNDNIRNITEPNPKRTYEFVSSKSGMRNSVASLVTVDNKGKTTRSPLFYNDREGVILRPTMCLPISGEELLIYGEDARRKKYRLGVVNFK